MAAMLACAAAGAWAQAGVRQVFTCTNAAGRTLTSDRLIGECMDREQRVLSAEGTLIRIVPPQLTADERAEKEARDRKAAAEREARLEAVRRDRLLLQRFPSEAEHEKARTSALEDLRASMRLSDARLAELERERKPLLDESEFYKGKQLPSALKAQLGLALPLLAFMTWPTSALKALSLPARNCATLSGLAAITSSMIASSAPVSFICFRPLASMTASTSAALARPQRVEHLARGAVGHRAVGDAADQRGQLRGGHRRCSMPVFARSGAATPRPSSSCCQLGLAAGLGAAS
jgi:hypothetical protein